MHMSPTYTEYLKEAAWIIGEIAAILTGIGVIWKKLIRPYLVVKVLAPVKQHILNIAQLSEMAFELKALLPKLGLVVKAVLPNNGSSMPDSLNRLEVAIAALQTQNDDNSALSEAMLWNHPKAMFRCDDKGSNGFVNNSYGKLLKVDTDALQGLGWRSYVLPDDILKYDSIWKQAFAEQRACWFNIRMMDSERNIIPVSVQFTVLRNHQGKFCGFLGMVDLHNEH